MESSHKKFETEKGVLDVAIEYHRALRFEMNEKIRFQWRVDSWKFALVVAFVGVFKTTDQLENLDKFWGLLLSCLFVMDCAIYYRLREIEPMANYICETLEKQLIKPLMGNVGDDVLLWEEHMRDKRESNNLFLDVWTMVFNVSTLFSIFLALVLSWIFLDRIKDEAVIFLGKIPGFDGVLFGSKSFTVLVFSVLISALPLILTYIFSWLTHLFNSTKRNI